WSASFTSQELLQVEGVAGEHLLRADLARQDLLSLSELDHGLNRLMVARHTIGERVIPHQATALRQDLLFAGQVSSGAQLPQKPCLRLLEGSEQPRPQRRVGPQERVLDHHCVVDGIESCLTIPGGFSLAGIKNEGFDVRRIYPANANSCGQFATG